MEELLGIILILLVVGIFVFGLCLLPYFSVKGLFSSSLNDRWVSRICLCMIVGFFLFSRSCLDSRVKNRQSEAKQTLGTIAKNQEAYFSEFQTYADSSGKLEVVVKSEGSRRYYTYSYSGVSATGYTAIATSIAPGISNCGGGEGDDVWTINEKLSLQNTESAIEHNQKCYLQRYFYFVAVFFAFFVLYDFLIYKLKRETSRHHDYDLCKKRSAKNVSENIEKCPACGSSDIHWVYIRNGKFGYKCSHCKEISSENEKGDMSG